MKKRNGEWRTSSIRQRVRVGVALLAFAASWRIGPASAAPAPGAGPVVYPHAGVSVAGVSAPDSAVIWWKRTPFVDLDALAPMLDWRVVWGPGGVCTLSMADGPGQAGSVQAGPAAAHAQAAAPMAVSSGPLPFSPSVRSKAGQGVPAARPVTIQGPGWKLASTLLMTRGRRYVAAPALAALGVAVSVRPASHAVDLTPLSLLLPDHLWGSVYVAGVVLNSAGGRGPGRAAVVNRSGAVVVVNTDASGAFSVWLPTAAPAANTAAVAAVRGAGGSGNLPLAAVAGVWTADDGWTGEWLPVQSGHPAPVVVQADTRQAAVAGRIAAAGSAGLVRAVSIRDVLTHVHYYAPVGADGRFALTLPEGWYEVYAALTDGGPVLLMKPFAAKGRTALAVQLPSIPSSGILKSSHVQVAAGDSQVTPEDLVAADVIFEHVYPEVSGDLGAHLSAPLSLTLYSGPDTYQQHFAAEGYSADEAKRLAQESAAAYENGSIAVDLAAWGAVDPVNVIAHELTHALLAQLSQRLPSWANEGIAWHEGVRAELDGSPEVLLRQGVQWMQWAELEEQDRDGGLAPLGASDPLNSSYNVESQDYFAVEQWIERYGWGRLMGYVRRYDADASALQSAIGETFDAFAAQVAAAIDALAHRGSSTAGPGAAGTAPADATAAAASAGGNGAAGSGWSLTLKILPGGPRALYVQAPGGACTQVNGLVPGQTYTFTCTEEGQVRTPAGLTVNALPAMQTVDSQDWFVGVTGWDGPFPRQEFELASASGQPFTVRILLYGAGGSVEHAYPATAIPAGVQLIALQTGGTAAAGTS
ncbi:MAG: hypothetical protein IRZ33_06875 [Alicyclobacillaceae bacterium]|nr:hypothetical protein [Alicyclobacillaceae bacterium]